MSMNPMNWSLSSFRGGLDDRNARGGHASHGGAASAHARSRGGKNGRSQRKVQRQAMIEQQKLEQVQRTQRFLEQIEKATQNVREYVDAVATDADDDTLEGTNLIAGMSLRAMRMSSGALRKDGLNDALKLGRRKIMTFYRENAESFEDSPQAGDIFEQYIAYMRSAVEGKKVPRLPVALPEETTDADASRYLNDAVGNLIGGYHAVDDGDRRTAENFEQVKASHDEMLRQAREADDEKVDEDGPRLDATKFNQHIRGEQVVFSEEYMAEVERASKSQRYEEVVPEIHSDAMGTPMLGGFTGEDGDFVMGEASVRSVTQRKHRQRHR